MHSPMKTQQSSCKTRQSAGYQRQAECRSRRGSGLVVKLSALRKRIDRLDRQLLRLLSQRAQLAFKVGSVKQQYDLPVFDRKRENLVIKQVVSANKGPLQDAAVKKVFREILRQVRRFEESNHH